MKELENYILKEGKVFPGNILKVDSFLNHLFRTDEGFGTRLMSIHNIRFLVKLMEDARTAIKNDRYNDFKNEVLQNMKFDQRGF